MPVTRCGQKHPTCTSLQAPAAKPLEMQRYIIGHDRLVRKLNYRRDARVGFELKWHLAMIISCTVCNRAYRQLLDQ